MMNFKRLFFLLTLVAIGSNTDIKAQYTITNVNTGPWTIMYSDGDTLYGKLNSGSQKVHRFVFGQDLIPVEYSTMMPGDFVNTGSTISSITKNNGKVAVLNSLNLPWTLSDTTIRGNGYYSNGSWSGIEHMVGSLKTRGGSNIFFSDNDVFITSTANNLSPEANGIYVNGNLFTTYNFGLTPMQFPSPINVPVTFYTTCAIKHDNSVFIGGSYGLMQYLNNSFNYVFGYTGSINSMAVDALDNIYVLTTSGNVSTIYRNHIPIDTVNGAHSIICQGGSIYYANVQTGKIVRLDPNGNNADTIHTGITSKIFPCDNGICYTATNGTNKVTVPNFLPTTDLPSDTAICYGEEIHISASANNANSVYFSYNDGPWTNDTVLTPLISGHLKFYTENFYGSSDTATVGVTVNPTPSMGLNQTYACSGTTVNLIPPLVPQSIMCQPVTINNAGSYQISVTDIQTGCQAFQPLTVVYHPQVAIQSVSCQGTAALIYEGNDGNGYATGNLIDANNCAVNMNGFSVQLPTYPSNGPNFLCVGGQLQLNGYYFMQGNVIVDTVNSGGIYRVYDENYDCLVRQFEVIKMNPNISYNAGQLTASFDNGFLPQQLQWTINGGDIFSADSPTHIPTVNGQYRIRASNDGCTELSNTIDVHNLSIEDLMSQDFITIIQTGTGLQINLEKEATLAIYDIGGKMLYNEKSQSHSIELTSGIYIVAHEGQFYKVVCAH